MAALGAGLVGLAAHAAPGAAEPWRIETGADAGEPLGRHEAAGVAVDGRMYLLGGRRGQGIDVHDPVARTWTALDPMPLPLHHFQPVVLGTEIWIVGAFTGDYPRETAVAEIHAYDTLSRTWRIAGEVPETRRRGSAAAVLHEDGLVYVLGGNARGHDGGAVPWFDRFDPVSGVWEALPDAPHARDHFGAAILGDVLVAAGGRATALPDPFANTVGPTDAYRFADGAWTARSAIPTPRAGAFTAGHGSELIVAGGEVSDRDEALATVEAFDARTNRWRALRPLNVGRHGGGAAVLGDRLHVVAGSDVRGGGDTSVHESLGLETGGPGHRIDTDGDGLSDEAEAELGTDPAVSDTDGDGLDDGRETSGGSDPLRSDTDADGVDDAHEVATRTGRSGGGGAAGALALTLGALVLAGRPRRALALRWAVRQAGPSVERARPYHRARLIASRRSPPTCLGKLDRE